ncbi:uncharacterized protein LOC128956156 [Oppia nitens]|uniref:uncharacterized protein LOC128956156 n=1 Tax=Oppia nitens TaxID=1686743 RepID=UPI0023DC8A47|nr:uncharacterized protein LOC128956156 [Oppia nitens]
MKCDEEIVKSNETLENKLFKTPKTDKIFGEDCVLPLECTRALHLTCISRRCFCDDGYHKGFNDTCILIPANNSLSELINNTPMIPILAVLGIMFVGICVVLNLFSRARFRKSRSIFVNPQHLSQAKAQERRASQLSQMSAHNNNGCVRSPIKSYYSPRNSLAGVSPTHSYDGKLYYGNHILERTGSPSNRSRSNSTASLQIHLNTIRPEHLT